MFHDMIDIQLNNSPTGSISSPDPRIITQAKMPADEESDYDKKSSEK
jgi:hypothetical protein